MNSWFINFTIFNFMIRRSIKKQAKFEKLYWLLIFVNNKISSGKYQMGNGYGK